MPYRANSASALTLETLGQAPLSSLPPGTYTAFTAIVPAGTSLATFNLATSSGARPGPCRNF